ncbi:MAG: hypothetical protein LBK26_02380 [Rickettsiales bacterium]|jgi:hypothetical protein|nr:hypothetical protein [Rickettsiales bacterium]
MKKRIYILIAVFLAAWILFRVVQISRESARQVFNIERENAKSGAPVETMTAEIKKDVLLEPIAVNNGRAYVSGARVHKFKAGQRLSLGGRVISVSRGIDLDTGLFLVRTSGPDGSMFAEMEHTGAFLPLSAVSGSSVMVSENGTAVRKEIKLVAADADIAVVAGLNNGDIVILGNVENGQKIRRSASAE